MESDEPLLRARDFMERDVITVSPETSILDVHRLFVEEEIHGAPVVGDDAVVYGVVSSLDLLRVMRDELEPGAGCTATTYFRDQLPYSGPDWETMPEDFQDRVQELTAADAMTRDLVAVHPDATAHEIAQTMLKHRVHRVLVTSDGSLLGIISTFDLLTAVTSTSPPESSPKQVRGAGMAS